MYDLTPPLHSPPSSTGPDHRRYFSRYCYCYCCCRTRPDLRTKGPVRSLAPRYCSRYCYCYCCCRTIPGLDQRSGPVPATGNCCCYFCIVWYVLTPPFVLFSFSLQRTNIVLYASDCCCCFYCYCCCCYCYCCCCCCCSSPDLTILCSAQPH